MNVAPFPPIEPYASGLLDVGGGQSVYWETSGNPEGTPVLVVHGGPGGGGGRGSRKSFDPARFRIVIYDQRGCGQSLPNAADPAVSLEANTTVHLLGDMEHLRQHLGVDRWLLFGGSWGTTLALAYAERHPDRVLGLVLVSITMGTRAERDWLYGALRVVFPEAWRRFSAATEGRPGDALLEGYARHLEAADREVREKAAIDWCDWENAVVSLEPSGRPGPYGQGASADVVAMARICVHYARHAAWLEEGVLLREAGRLAGIPGVILHGRHDLSCPPETAYALAVAWPEAELVWVDDAGHKGSAAMSAGLYAAIRRFEQELPAGR